MEVGRIFVSATTGIVLALGSAIAPVEAEMADKGVNIMSMPVNSHPSQGEVGVIEGAEAKLLAMDDGAFVSFATNGLTPGNVHTMWFVAINDPTQCETTPCKSSDVNKRTAMTNADVGYGDSLIVGEDGTAEFAAHIPIGDLRKAWHGNGYQNAQGAEIHLAIADHGPVIGDDIENMLSSYRGGCTDESLPGGAPDTAKTDGMAGPNTCRMMQFSIFEQEKAEQARVN